MSKPDDAAFPQGVPDDKFHWQHTGLTKRELFAAMAMQGILGAQEPWRSPEFEVVATWATAQADALLRKLEGAK